MTNKILRTVDILSIARTTEFRFRHDPKIVRFLMYAYGRMTIDRALEECHRRFGDRAPGRTSIHRFWKWLDKQVGIEAA